MGWHDFAYAEVLYWYCVRCVVVRDEWPLLIWCNSVGPCPLYCSVTAYGNGVPNLALDYVTEHGKGKHEIWTSYPQHTAWLTVCPRYLSRYSWHLCDRDSCLIGYHLGQRLSSDDPNSYSVTFIRLMFLVVTWQHKAGSSVLVLIGGSLAAKKTCLWLERGRVNDVQYSSYSFIRATLPNINISCMHTSLDSTLVQKIYVSIGNRRIHIRPAHQK
jgi:hypothetical protein